MEVVSAALFFLYLWGFGYATHGILKLKESSSFLERNITRMGTGMASLVLTAMVLSIIKVPLDWKVFLLLSIAYPAYKLAKNYRKVPAESQKLKLKVKASDINVIIVLAIFLGSLYMYASGAFAYPYLEDDDPWSHASGIKYIAVEKTFQQAEYRNFQYMNPYPPSYDFVLALMHQTESSLLWTMKFFNALIISLSLVFFYFFTNEFAQNRNKALMATIVLAAVPAYLSHFIWAPALAMMMFFPALYAIEMIKHGKKWKLAAAITAGGVLVAHPTHSLTLFALIGTYLAIKAAARRDFVSHIVAGIGGIAASLAWWGPHGKEFFAGNLYPAQIARAVEDLPQKASFISRAANGLLELFSPYTGTATRPYTFSDFFVAKGQNLINNPVGVGVVAGVLFIIGLIATPLMGIRKLGIEKRLGLTAIATIIFVFFVIAKQESVLMLIAVYAALMILVMIVSKEWKRKTYFFITLAWFLLSFLIVNNQTFNLPVGFYAFRTWMIMAVPLAIIAAEGVWNVFSLISMAGIDKKLLPVAKAAIIVAVIAGLWLTSGQQKYEVNTAGWPPGAFWTSIDEAAAYVWLQNLPPGTKVFSFLTDDQIIAMDKFSCGWCKSEAAYRQSGFGDTPQETFEWMKANGYEYIIIGGREIQQFGQNETISKMTGMAESGLFQVAHQTRGAVVFRTA